MMASKPKQSRPFHDDKYLMVVTYLFQMFAEIINFKAKVYAARVFYSATLSDTHRDAA